MLRGVALLLVLAAVVSAPQMVRGAITIDTVTIGNAGNAGELSGAGAGGYGLDAIVGGVSYDYRIGRYEVTNAEYAAFLNAKAASDPLALYHPSMGPYPTGGITRTGLSGSYSYAVKPNMGNKPVNYVSWYDAVRFVNWLHNGQGSGDTETGAYTLEGGTEIPSNGLSITRNAGALWFLPSEDEWYKAAYYDPTLSGGTGGYWDYPTRSNTPPTMATANSVGDISNPGANVANYYFGADWNGQAGNVTTVGSAGPLSESYYGTSDQGGNVWEWNEALIGSYRGARGGSIVNYLSEWLRASVRGDYDPSYGFDYDFGFRVAAASLPAVPEPSSLVVWSLLGLAGLGYSRSRRRASRRDCRPPPIQ